MKNGLLVWNALLTLGLGYLAISHFTGGQKKTAAGPAARTDSPAASGNFKIAYFEMDSVEANFSMVKDVKSEISKKEDAMNAELDNMDRTYRDKVNGYQQQAQTMNQTQSEMATQDVMKMQEAIKSRKAALDQDYNDLVMRRMKDVKVKIEEFLKTYNADRRYAYIVSYEQGLFYYKDSAYNITADVIAGLNDLYKSKKN
jgi:outer membrane protein